MRTVVISAVGHFHTAVLGVGSLVHAERRGLFFAEAHRLHLGLVHAQQRQRTADGFCALLAQCQVVLAATALVGVAFDDDLLALGAGALRPAGEPATGVGRPALVGLVAGDPAMLGEVATVLAWSGGEGQADGEKFHGQDRFHDRFSRFGMDGLRRGIPQNDLRTPTV